MSALVIFILIILVVYGIFLVVKRLDEKLDRALPASCADLDFGIPQVKPERRNRRRVLGNTLESIVPDKVEAVVTKEPTEPTVVATVIPVLPAITSAAKPKKRTNRKKTDGL